jgi:hypothetical protein
VDGVDGLFFEIVSWLRHGSHALLACISVEYILSHSRVDCFGTDAVYKYPDDVGLCCLMMRTKRITVTISLASCHYIYYILLDCAV